MWAAEVTLIFSVKEICTKYRLQQERQNENIHSKIASDSTLWRAHHLGLKADVMCMPGGRFGHVVNAIRDDPGMEGKNNVIIVARKNDIDTPYETNHEFAYGIDKGLDKLRFHVNEIHPEQIVTIVHM